MEDRDMIKAICVAKNRDEKGNIVNYTLKDANNQLKKFTSKEIKDGIRAGQLVVKNLQIDKAGRLVDKAAEKVKEKKSVNKQISEFSERDFMYELKNLIMHGLKNGIQCNYYKDTALDKFHFDNVDSQKDWKLKTAVIESRSLAEKIDFHKLVEDALKELGDKSVYFCEVIYHKEKDIMAYYISYKPDWNNVSSDWIDLKTLKRANEVYEKYLQHVNMEDIYTNFKTDRYKKFRKQLKDALFEKAKKSGISYNFNYQNKWEEVFEGVEIFKDNKLLDVYGMDVDSDAYDLVDDMEREYTNSEDNTGYASIYMNVVDEMGWMVLYKKDDIEDRRRAVKLAAEHYHSLMSDSVCGIEDKEEYEEALTNFFAYISTNIWENIVYTCSPYLCQDYILENRDDLIKEYGDEVVNNMLMYLSSLIKRKMCISSGSSRVEGPDGKADIRADIKEFCKKYEIKYTDSLADKIQEINRDNYNLFETGYNGQSLASQELLKYLKKLAVRKR